MSVRDLERKMGFVQKYIYWQQPSRVSKVDTAEGVPQRRMVQGPLSKKITTAFVCLSATKNFEQMQSVK